LSASPKAEEARAAAPRVDHHQHLLSERALNFTIDWLRKTGDPSLRDAETEQLVDAGQLVRMLDEAGIAKALVFSNAYYFARSAAEEPGEYEVTKAENDWTLAQVRRHPTRLYAACSVNPLRRYATAEIERCAASGDFRALKLHFNASAVDLANPQHVASVGHAFATANRMRLPIVVHLQSQAGYGERQARSFLNEILPRAPAVPVTVNHLWGGGAYSAEALSVFAQAFQRRDPKIGNLWFDLAQVSMVAPSDKDRMQIVERMRQIGLARLLYGSDGPQWGGVRPKQHWQEFDKCMPLTREEHEAVTANVAPFLRETAAGRGVIGRIRSLAIENRPPSSSTDP
jgi:predicted TIM-barrel fold metal-dependent hydrolase